MSEKILRLPTFKAHRALKHYAPLGKEEMERMKALIPSCPLEGQPFDEESVLYPFIIPRKAVVYVLSEDEGVYSLGLRFKRTEFVNIIGNDELLEAYQANLGEFLFAVGRITKREKNGREYQNLRPRGWLVVRVDSNGTTGAGKKASKGKTSKK